MSVYDSIDLREAIADEYVKLSELLAQCDLVSGQSLDYRVDHPGDAPLEQRVLAAARQKVWTAYDAITRRVEAEAREEQQAP